MKNVLTGNCTCSASDSIEEGAIAEISILDVSRCGAPAITLSKLVVENPKSFPLSFQIEYEQPTRFGSYCVSIRISKNEKLLYINDTRFSITDETGNYLSHIDLFVIKID